MRADDVIAEGPTLLAADAPAAPPAGERLSAGARAGDYEVERFVGAGAMGDVYAGRHPLIGKRVAIKVIKRHLAAAPEATERFLREARAVNQVGHPNVVDVFAVGRLDDGRLFLVMDLLEGESLGARLRRGHLEADDALHVLGAIAAALDAAHERGVVHRDLKPDNVFLADRGGVRPHVYVLDFGIAKLLAPGGDAPVERTLTDQGTWLGTPAYMAPEQWGADGAGPASDRYALGVIAFEALAGKPPFAAASLPGMMEQHFRAPVPALSTAAGRPLPARTDAVIARALAKDPDRRYPSAAALVEELRDALGTAVGRRARAAPSAPGAAARRPILAIALGGGTALAAIVTGAVVLRGDERPRPAAAPTPAPTGPALAITTTPAGARVRIDGADRGATPATIPVDGPPRELAITLERPGYVPVTRRVQVGGAAPEPLVVALTPIAQFEGVWVLPDGALRAFERRGDQVAMFTMASGSDERRFERFFEFVPDDAGAVAFAAAEDHVDPRGPDEPSCHVPLRARYTYDPGEDRLERRQERVQLDHVGGRCTQVAREWGPTMRLRRLAHADGASWAESRAGAGPGDLIPQVPVPAAEPDLGAELTEKKAPSKAPPRKGAGDARAPTKEDESLAAKRRAAEQAAQRKNAPPPRETPEEQRAGEQRRDLDARDRDRAQQATPPPTRE